MKADTISINDIFNSTKTKYLIPIYQRKYSWNSDNINKLFEDMLEVKNTNRKHFIGSIIRIDPGSGQVRVFNVIDGQQRITTISLFIIAYINSKNFNSKESRIEYKEEIFDHYLINKYCKDNENEYYKLCLIESDNELYKKIINNTFQELQDKLTKEEKNSNLYKNYSNFLKKIDEYKITKNEFETILLNITLVAITLDTEEEKNNAQLIFESINSTGINLYQGDLIKNLVLMSLSVEEQTQLYKKYWFDLETYLLNEEKLETFFKVYLIIKNDKYIKEDEVYRYFKEYYFKSELQNQQIIEEIYNYYLLFKKMLSNSTDSKLINKELSFLNALDQSVAYPLIVEVIKRYENMQITEADAALIIKSCASYIVRRAFSKSLTGSLQKVFIQLLSTLKSKDYLDKFIFKLLSLKDTQKMPRDKEFKENFININFYKMNNSKKLLILLEKYNNKNEINLENYSIEHVLPQGDNLPEAWKKELGEDWENIWEQYCHTIGNLTFTTYNSEMRNRPFQEKLEITGGFKETNIRLNKYISNCSNWTKEQILDRADKLFEIAKEMWFLPEIDSILFNRLKEENKNKEYDLSYYGLNNEIDNLYNDFLKLFEFKFGKYEIKYNKLYLNIVQNDKTIFQLTFSKKNIKIYFNNKNLYEDQSQIKDESNVGRHVSCKNSITLNKENKQEIFENINNKFD